MKKHTKIYLDAFGLSTGDSIPSEISGQPANDIHHIIARGMGGRNGLDRIENLMAVTRDEHLQYGDKKKFMKSLFQCHKFYLELKGVDFDKKWIDEQIERYSIH